MGVGYNPAGPNWIFRPLSVTGDTGFRVYKNMALLTAHSLRFEQWSEFIAMGFPVLRRFAKDPPTLNLANHKFLCLKPPTF